MKSKLKGAGFYIGLLLVLVVVLTLLSGRQTQAQVTYSDLIRYFENGQVQEFTVEDNVVSYLLKDGNATGQVKVISAAYFLEDVKEYVDAQRKSDPSFKYDLVAPFDPPWWLTMLPYVLLIGAAIFVWMYMMNQAGGGGGTGKAMSFGKARVKKGTDEKRKVTFKDVAGADEEKEELAEVVSFLKNPKRFIEFGARIPKGILLVGPPGTGKTLLAKAVAGEAGVPFFSISGSDFVEMFVGVGASRVRDLFDQAKKSAPAIIFIDEIDAVGRQRGAGLGGGHDEREQTLNQLLVEMDGFGVNEGVIVIAATNRADILDPALLRPGRFDRQVFVGYPDINGREAILKVHAKGKPFAEDVKLSVIAKTTAGFTGADLENLLNEAALLAARRNRKAITMEDIEEATIKVIAGPEKKSRVVSEKEKKLTAYHEAGHAIVTYSLPNQDPVHEISIIPRGRAGGYTLSLPTEDRYYQSKSDMLEQITTLLGGRVAEHLILGDISTGASNDIQRASSIARKMVTMYGMSEKLGPIVFGTGHEEVFLGRDFSQGRNYSETVAAEIDEEVKKLIDGGYHHAEQILKDHINELHKVAKYLFEYEKMDAGIFAKAMAGENIDPQDPAPLPSQETAAGMLPDDSAAQQPEGDDPSEAQ